jgi:hypothetical protein
MFDLRVISQLPDLTCLSIIELPLVPQSTDLIARTLISYFLVSFFPFSKIAYPFPLCSFAHHILGVFKLHFTIYFTSSIASASRSSPNCICLFLFSLSSPFPLMFGVLRTILPSDFLDGGLLW